METPLVSVIVATRNRAGPLAAALASIRAQTFDRFEVIVVDDGSDAATLDAYSTLWAGLDRRFRLERPIAAGVPGTGPSPARNRGARVSGGIFLAFLDDDDLWSAPDHLGVAVAALEAGPADYFFADLASVRGDTVVLPGWYTNYPRLRNGRRVCQGPDVVEVDLTRLAPLMRHSSVHLNTTVVRRSLFEKVGGFCERLRYGEDYDLFLRLADAAGGIRFRPEPVARYHLPAPGSASALSEKEQALQMLAVTQHARSVCNGRVVRRMARAREAWYLRELARTTGRMSFAWQSLCTFPTLGGLFFFIRSLYLHA